MPLSEHSAGERAGTKLLRELRALASGHPTKLSQRLVSLLRMVGFGLVLLLLIVACSLLVSALN